MKKNILFSCLLGVVFSVLLNSPTVSANTRNQVVPSFWVSKVYNPKLYLLPNFNFTLSNPLTNDCNVHPLPFWEGFNSSSPTLSCWQIIDGKNINQPPSGNNIWKPHLYTVHEGNQSMSFTGAQTNDGWLISPIFQLDSTKTYKLRYHYRANSWQKNELEVLASNRGNNPVNFTHIIVPKSIYNNNSWIEEVAFISDLAGPVHLAWRVHTEEPATIYIDNVYFEEVACYEPQDLTVTSLKSNQATLYWNDPINDSWEYFVEKANGNGPLTSGTTTTTQEVVINSDHNNSNLEPATAYHYYVRASCQNGSLGAWIGPFTFWTACSPISTPYTEGFNSSSPTYNCWRLLDNNRDQVPSGNNGWKQHHIGSYEGDRCMYFFGTGRTTVHDDWLISPAFSLNGGIYAITYYYKTDSYNAFRNEFEVLLSTNGTDPADFSTVLEPVQSRSNAEYIKKVLYIQNITTDINIAWHVVATGTAYLFIDQVTIEEVPCLPPDENITLTNLETDQVILNWNDTKNSSWEYYLQEKGSGIAPIGSGLLANNQTLTLTKTSGNQGVNLQADTEYEFFLRSSCGPGQYSYWVGPLRFKTPCDNAAIPFWEGFNTDSNTNSCWTIISKPKDSDHSPHLAHWKINPYSAFEGNQMMSYYGINNSDEREEWLISPPFRMESHKFYRLKYHYKTRNPYSTDFEVWVSNNGTNPSSFTQKLTSRKMHSVSNWTQETLILGQLTGTIHIAWHITTANSYSGLDLDNIILEEVTGCPEPTNLQSETVSTTSATIQWDDRFGSNWEYIVQESDGSIPLTAGSQTDKRSNIITKDRFGTDLKPNTEYEFYVRSTCSTSDYSIWMGPIAFRTPCSNFVTPIWEGFEPHSQAVYCWTVIDKSGNSTALTASQTWSIKNHHPFEGVLSAYFNTTDYTNSIESDDWLISPTIRFESHKTYRLKYHYTTSLYTDKNEFEVLASNTGTAPINFNKQIVASETYTNDTYQPKIVFINDLAGDIHLAWHVKGTGSKTVFIDNIYIEEVIGCPEPLQVTADDITAQQLSLSWTDVSNASSWEYFIQPKGQSPPTSNGTVTNQIQNTINTDQLGHQLLPNTDYDIYVRTICENGSYSIWTGPQSITTRCGILDTPFWENFNSHSKQLRCWTLRNANTPETQSNARWSMDSKFVYEGDQSIRLNIQHPDDNTANSQWLISPKIIQEQSAYVLKYHYTASQSRFEVLASKQGTAVEQFTDTLVAPKNYNNTKWREEVVFFDGTTDSIHLAWHVNNPGNSVVRFDDVILKKVTNCPEPYYITQNSATASTVAISWQQNAAIHQWEVKVVNSQDNENGVAIQTLSVNTNPQTIISGLDSATTYKVYIRALCSNNNTYSDWSTAATVGTTADLHSNCDKALNIPVNTTKACDVKIWTTFLGASPSSTVAPNCVADQNRPELWFEFTALATEHLLSLSDFNSPSHSPFQKLHAAIYNQDCSQISQNAWSCFEINSDKRYQLLKPLIVGQKYYIRLTTSAADADVYFSLCLNTPSFITVSPAGEIYSIEQLVQDKLIQSDCHLVSNIRYKTGSSYNNPNGIGYFESNSSSFGFGSGIILATNGVETSMGPSNEPHSDGNENWKGDQDLERLLTINGQPGPTHNASVIEFDFIPITDTIKFDFIFASDEYGDHQCEFSDVFAFFLTDLETKEVTNLAVVPGTQIPISPTTIRDEKYRTQGHCSSVNETYFDSFYGIKGFSHQDNPINYKGLTIPLTATSAVKPGKKYHIKLAIADYQDVLHNSAVFIKEGSFHLGNIDLGDDLLIATNNAVCNGQSQILTAALANYSGNTIEWFKDGDLIPQATDNYLEVFESGTYKIVVRYPELDCETTGSVTVEIYPPISSVVLPPEPVTICRTSLNPVVIDFTQVEPAMLANTSAENYQFSYYNSYQDATAEINPIDPQNSYLEIKGIDLYRYILVKDLRTDCLEVFEWHFKSTAGPLPEPRADVVICDRYILPALENNQKYYSEAGAQGEQYNSGDLIDQPGSHTVYLFQDNGSGCYEEISYKILITATIKAKVFKDEELECEYYELQELPAHNRYFTEKDGQGHELFNGSIISTPQTVYVFAISEDGLCSDQSSFTIRFKDCPIPKGISPNGDGYNDRFNLSQHAVTSIRIYNRYGTEVYHFQGDYTDQWHGQSQGGKSLPDGTYYYVLISNNKTRTGWVYINR